MSDAPLRAGIDQTVVFEDESAILRQRRRVAGLQGDQFAHGWFEKVPAGAVAGDSTSRQAAIDRPPLAALPASNDSISLHAAVSEHFDQRAVAPLADLLHEKARCQDQGETLQRAVQWLDQLFSDDDRIDLKLAVEPLAEVAQWTQDPATGLSAIKLLKLIAATSPKRKQEVHCGLRKAIKNQSTEEVRSAAREAITALRQPEAPPDSASNGKAAPNQNHTTERAPRPAGRRR